MRRCFNCGIELNKNNGRHIYWCCKNQNISKDHIRFKQICFENGKEWTKEDFQRLYLEEGLSLPDFKKQFGLIYPQTQFLIGFFGIKPRSNKEAMASPKRTGKYKNTCQKRYGYDNVSQTEEVKKKKQSTFIKHYGVDNIWKLPAYYDWLHPHMIAKYGKASLPNRFGNKTKWWASLSDVERESLAKKVSDGNLSFWANASDEKKREWSEQRKQFWANLTDEEKSLFVEKNLSAQRFASRQEGRIASILTDMQIEFKRHMWIAGLNYDFKIEGFGKTILEYNGDYWHANPDLYKSDDLIKYPGEIKKASDIWTRDEYKREIARRYGYRVIYIWEKEAQSKNNIELGKLIVDRLEQHDED